MKIEIKKIEETIVHLFKRLIPKLTSRYTYDKKLEEMQDKTMDLIMKDFEDKFGPDVHLLSQGEDGQSVPKEQLDPFYQSIQEEEDDAYSQFEDEKLRLSGAKRKKTGIIKTIREAASSIFLARRGIIARSGFAIQRKQPREIREQVQAAMYIQSFENPIVKGVIENTRRFIQGRGTKFHCQVPEIQEILDNFWKKNDMSTKEKRIMHNSLAESELFLIHIINGVNGDTQIREVSPGEIPMIETDPEDTDVILSYTREFIKNQDNDNVSIMSSFTPSTKIYADIDYFDQKDEEFGVTSRHDVPVEPIPDDEDKWQGEFRLMQFVKLGKNREVRSRVIFQPILKWTKIYENWLKDRAVLNHERARVVWILTMKGKFPENTNRHKIAPSSGIVKVENEKQKWRAENAKINADEAKDDGRAILHMVATGAEMPVSVFAQIVDDAVYASIKKADTPFTQHILDLQDTYRNSFYNKMFQKVIKSKVKYGNLKEKFKVKKYLQEYHKDAYRIQKRKFDNGSIDNFEMLKTVKEITHDFLIESFFDNSFDKSPEGKKEMTDKCSVILEGYDDNLEHILESEDNTIDESLNNFKILFEKGIDVSVDAEDVPIDIIFPEIVKEDPLNQAKTLLILKNIGVSMTSLMRQAGFDPEKEAAFRAIEKETGLFDDIDKDEMNTNNDKVTVDGKAPNLKKSKKAAGDGGDGTENK